MTPIAGSPIVTESNAQGLYEFKSLPAGKYTLTVAAPGFTLYQNENVVIADQPLRLNDAMTIEVETQKVQVSDSAPTIDVNPSSNAGAIVISGKELEALPDDPDELQSDLQALAGPSAGPNGGQMYIDGVTAGQLPPKASIREIRINQNPFSSEYDKLGYGRIEIFTKPGSNQFHGQLFVTGNTAGLNSRNPFEGTTQTPGYYSTQYSANLGAPLGKKASVFFNIERRNLNELSVINTPFVDPSTLQFTQFTDAVSNPRTRTNLSQRLDYQVTKNNTLTARYQYWRNNENSDGIGTFSLPSVGYNSLSSEHSAQISDTQVVSSRTINETRFQFVHETVSQNPLSTFPTIQIQGAFVGGGSSGGFSNDTQKRYELQNITFMTFGKHAIKYGGRLRATNMENDSNARFNGVYSFGSRLLPNCTPTATNSCQVTGLQAYLITLQDLAKNPQNPGFSANGGGASYYSLNSNAMGFADANVTWFDGAVFLQDDWRIRPNLTLSTGVRYEMQNDLGDHTDVAPRIGIAWAIDGNGKNKSPNTVLRFGYGF